MQKTMDTIFKALDTKDIVIKLEELEIPTEEVELIMHQIVPGEKNYNSSTVRYAILTLPTSEKLLNLYKEDNKAFDLGAMFPIINQDAKDMEGNTILHLAVQEGIESLLNCFSLYLLYSPNSKNHTGFTPLHLAAERGNINAISILHEKGAALDAQNNTGATPLHVAASTGQVEALKTLLKLNPALIDIPDLNNNTALMIAAKSGDINTVKTLQELKANKVNATTQQNITVATIPKNQVFKSPIQELVQDIQEASQSIDMQIYKLAKQGSTQKLKALLLNEGINKNAKFKKGRNNALHVARKNNNVVDQLIAFGFPLDAKNLDAKNKEWQTTLAVIIKNQDEDRVLPSIMERVEQAPADERPLILKDTIKAIEQTQYPEQNSEEQTTVDLMVSTLRNELNKISSVSQSLKREATAMDDSTISTTKGFTPSPTPSVGSPAKKPRVGR
ncbi:ankyrin repeat domain-containing protein [Candidatus Tisiphia endosymbiont of Beris chalybata]|uniref:ankyrin repeat domain-containing protein n=1 Tax=Candidatus Tisiphia endosymbiont of Beris chalybata TaxID=3066262 RepID=UPI00312CBC9E